MTATIFYLSAEVREAALDLRSLRRKIEDAGERGFEWLPAEANARKRLIGLSREHSEDRAPLHEGWARIGLICGSICGGRPPPTDRAGGIAGPKAWNRGRA